MQRYSLLIFILSTQTNASEILASSAALQKQLDERVTREVASLQRTTQISPAVGQAIASVGEAIGGSVGRRVTGFATVGASLYSNMKLLSASPAALASMGIEPITLGLGIFSGVCSLIGMFNDNDDELAEALSRISQQLSIFHRETMESFERLEEILDIGHRQILAEFLQVHKDQRNIKQRLKALHKRVQENQVAMLDSMQSLRQQQLVQHHDVIDQFTSLRLETVDEKIADITAALRRGEINGTNLGNYIHELHKCITIIAKSPALTAATATYAEQGFDATSLKNWQEHPAFKHINVLRQYYIDKFGDVVGPQLAHPFVYARCINVLATLLSHVRPVFASEPAKRSCLEDIAAIIKEGQQVLDFYKAVQEPARVQALVADFSTALDTVRQATETILTPSVDLAVQKLSAKTISTAIDNDVKTLQALPTLGFRELLDTLVRKRKGLPLKDGLFFPINAFSTKYWNQKKLLAKLLWRDKPVAEDAKLFQWLSDLAKKGVRGEVTSYEFFYQEIDRIAQQRVVQHQQDIQQALITLKKPRLAHQPASLLLHPRSDSPYKQALMCTDIAVDPVYIQAERLGLGTITSYYSVVYPHFVIETFFEKARIQTIKLRYDLPDTKSDEHIVNFWYGGRYAKISDIMHDLSIPFGSRAPLAGRPLRARKGLMIPVDPYPAAYSQLAAAPKDVANQDIDKVRAMIAEKLRQERVTANKEIIAALKVPTTPLAQAVNALNKRYTMLEALFAFLYNEQLLTSPFANLMLASQKPPLIKDAKSFSEYAEWYPGNTIYAPFAAADIRSEIVVRKMQQMPPQFPLLLQTVARLRQVHLMLHEAQVVTPTSETDSLRREVIGLREQMDAQSRQIAQLLALLQAQGR